MLSFQPLTVADWILLSVALYRNGVMGIKEEAVFCNLPKEMFSKSLGMPTQKWAADVDGMVAASIATASSLSAYLHLCSLVHFLNVSSFLVSTQRDYCT